MKRKEIQILMEAYYRLAHQKPTIIEGRSYYEISDKDLELLKPFLFANRKCKYELAYCDIRFTIDEPRFSYMGTMTAKKNGVDTIYINLDDECAKIELLWLIRNVCFYCHKVKVDRIWGGNKAKYLFSSAERRAEDG